jgi:peptidoglycan/LPS O-acetylase OafA/YrhL
MRTPLTQAIAALARGINRPSSILQGLFSSQNPGCPMQRGINRTTSLYLDIIRPLAALVVLLSHASYGNLTGGQLAFMGSAGVQAVDMFFVLSGFVIAYVCDEKESDYRTYFISRAARIYSVAIPSIIFVFICDEVGKSINPLAYTGPYQDFSAGLIVRSLLFIGEMWNAHRFPGSNGPYWSLGFEVWYYIAYGAFIFLPKPWKWYATILVLTFIGPKVTVMFPAWLIGVATYHLCKRQYFSKTAGTCLFSLSILLLTLFETMPHSSLPPFTNISISPERLASTLEDYLLALIFAINIIGFSAISDKFSSILDPKEKIIRWIAGGTFSIYLIHLPVMHLFSAISPWQNNSVSKLVFLLAATPVACMVFAEISERRKTIWKTLFSVGMMKTPAHLTLSPDRPSEP